VTFPHVRVEGGPRERGRAYGEQAADFMKKYGAEIGIGLAIAAIVVGFVVVKLRQKK